MTFAVWLCFLFVCFLFDYSLYFLLQRLDAGALTHDHGADISKAARLSGIHDFQCFDHELDLTVNAGLDCPTFAPIFIKASNVVSTIRSSNNFYRKLRDDQVRSLFICSSYFCHVPSPCLCSWSCGQTTLYVLYFQRSLCALGGSPSMGCWNLYLQISDPWEGCVRVMTNLAARCMIKTCHTQNGKSLRSVFVCCRQIMNNYLKLELVCLDRNPCQFSSAYRISPSCSRVRTMYCRRHIGVLSLMSKTCLLLMRQILRLLQLFDKRCTMIISTTEWLWRTRLLMFCMFWWHYLIQGFYIAPAFCRW